MASITRLGKADKKGVTLRQRLERHEERSGITPDDLLPPDVPPAGEHLWQWFWELEKGRTGNGYGPSPFSWSDIDAWARLHGERPRPWELAILRAMDAERLRVSSDSTGKSKSGQAMQPAKYSNIVSGFRMLMGKQPKNVEAGSASG
ncbi:hypothetical protein FHS82_001058 [Pseudochelatococcus lubricantis]|uniref:Uncharacterized protein n=1 Tax=Pseudochelatococcus lubricantis TaxID=1538102 RepID=A0ABX0UWA5_9HYPH|nr:hypothetical protein [Pseudochelatococcus lubricantis]NIJ57232.1 hypothetical protein [Pseudochelatococcus lubricantis]